MRVVSTRRHGMRHDLPTSNVLQSNQQAHVSHRCGYLPQQIQKLPRVPVRMRLSGDQNTSQVHVRVMDNAMAPVVHRGVAAVQRSTIDSLE